MVVKILDGKLNIKQDEQTKNGGQIVEGRVSYSWPISGTICVTSDKNPEMIPEWEKTKYFCRWTEVCDNFNVYVNMMKDEITIRVTSVSLVIKLISLLHFN